MSRGRRALAALGAVVLALLLTACPDSTSDPGGDGDLRECLEDNKGVNC